MVPEVPATGEPGTNSFSPLSARLFGLKNVGFKNEWFDCPSPTLTAQPENGQLMRSTYQTGFYGRSVTPGCRRRPWGDLVVPTGWRWWGRSMDFPSFSFAAFRSKGWREIVHQAVRKGQLDPLPQGSQMRDPGRAADSNYRPCMIHTRSDQLPILPPLRSWQPIFVSVESFSGMFRSSSPLLRKSEPPVQVQDTIITAWTIMTEVFLILEKSPKFIVG